ncbi:MAG: hypothetical protein Q4E87_08595 [bacterium]|nr:hypothetical protein [bacterium]
MKKIQEEREHIYCKVPKTIKKKLEHLAVEKETTVTALVESAIMKTLANA